MNILDRLNTAYSTNPDPDYVANSLYNPFSKWRLVRSLQAKDFEENTGLVTVIYDPTRKKFGQFKRVINSDGIDSNSLKLRYTSSRHWRNHWYIIDETFAHIPWEHNHV